jgi:hypothetical protein
MAFGTDTQRHAYSDDAAISGVEPILKRDFKNSYCGLGLIAFY